MFVFVTIFIVAHNVFTYMDVCEANIYITTRLLYVTGDYCLSRLDFELVIHIIYVIQ